MTEAQLGKVVGNRNDDMLKENIDLTHELKEVKAQRRALQQRIFYVEQLLRENNIPVT